MEEINLAASLATDADLVGYFGYGSLVNAMTWRRAYVAHEAKLRNWGREWRHCVELDSDPICALTVSHQSQMVIEGVLILCPRNELKHVDERELGYVRHALPSSDLSCSLITYPNEMFIYRSIETYYKFGSRHFPIWFSYLECVLYGYLFKFGKAGVDRFISSTRGWTTPILDDRANPKYPRAHDIPVEDRRLLDETVRKIDGTDFFQA
jgi:hypothetical protein